MYVNKCTLSGGKQARVVLLTVVITRQILSDRFDRKILQLVKRRMVKEHGLVKDGSVHTDCLKELCLDLHNSLHHTQPHSIIVNYF